VREAEEVGEEGDAAMAVEDDEEEEEDGESTAAAACVPMRSVTPVCTWISPR
jgi:hypothetical protein